MRDYSKVAPQFWNGKTGKALKAKGSEAVIVALYLMTCQHANMLGLYYLSKAYIAVDTGLGFEGASKGLAWACEVGFCHYDEDSEVVWVVEMAAYQVGERLEPKDNQVKGIQRHYDSLPENPFLGLFYERYGQAFHMAAPRGTAEPLRSPSEDPPKPRAGAGERSRTGAGAGTGSAPAGAAAGGAEAPSKRGTRLPADWMLPKAWGEWAVATYPHWTPDTVRAIAGKFRNYWVAKAGKDATKLDWKATWENWCASGITQQEHPAPTADQSAEQQRAESHAKAERVRRLLETTPGLMPAADLCPPLVQRVDAEESA